MYIHNLLTLSALGQLLPISMVDPKGVIIKSIPELVDLSRYITIKSRFNLRSSSVSSLTNYLISRR